MKIQWCFNVLDVSNYGFGLEKAFQQIVKAFLGEPHLLAVSVTELTVSFTQGLSVVGFTDNGALVCHARLINLIGNWFELGSTYVCPDFRGRQINHKMYEVFLPRHSGKDILATTTNPVSRRVGKDLGFVEISRRSLPKEVWVASCTCPAKKIGTSNPECCPLAFGESFAQTGLCYFRVTKETAVRHNFA